MNPSKQFTVQIDPKDGTFWIVIKKPGQRFRKVAEVTDQVMLGLVADLIEDKCVRAIERDIIFADGRTFKVTIEDPSMVPVTTPKAA